MPSNHWFGPGPFAPICEEVDRVPIPVGELCSWCEEHIEPDQNGIEMVHGWGPGWEYRPIHQECLMRSVIGSLAHIEGRCTCFGGTMDFNEPRMSKRQEALIVFQRWLAGNGRPPMEKEHG